MKLIDYDKYLEMKEGAYDCSDEISIVDMCKVDAIPVEWIYKWLENIPNNWRGYSDDWNYNIDGEVSHVNVWGKYNIMIPCIGDMLDDWSREVKLVHRGKKWII